MKLLNDRCFECSICAIFLSSSFTVSIRALFSKKNSICHTQQGILHLVLHFGDQLNSVQKQVFKQGLSYISFVSTELSFDILQKMSLFQRFSVVYISRRKHKTQDFTLVIDYQMQFKPENHFMEHFPRVASPSKVLCISMH